MIQTIATRVAAFTGFSAVALGAFGAHGLHDLLVRNATLAIWEKAALYHLVHAVVLLVVVNLKPLRRWSVILFFAGIVIFSGSLYALALTGVKWLGAITPLGGLCLLAGWASLSIRPRSEVNL